MATNDPFGGGNRHNFIDGTDVSGILTMRERTMGGYMIISTSPLKDGPDIGSIG